MIVALLPTSGHAAVLNADGRTFAEAKLERIGRIGISS